MAESSEDEQPLIKRVNKNKESANAAPALAPEPAVKNEPVSDEKKPQQPAVMDSDSEDDKPLAKKAALLPAAHSEPLPKSEPLVKKEAVVKKEPVAKKGLAVVKKAASAVAAVKTEAKKESSSSPAPSGPLKKSFSMPGQTREPPPENDSLRKFYTSLLKQRPESEMAKRWCLQHGLLEEDEAKRVAEELGKMSAKSPAKPPRPSAPPARSSKPAPKRKVVKRAVPADDVERRTKKKIKYEELEEESDDDEPLAKRVKPAPAKASAKAAAASKPAAKRDTAFMDGGMNSDSDDSDDVPLAQRKIAA